MLKKQNENEDWSGAEIKIREAVFPSPFLSGLEYNAPARGPWNIVHTGMLIPESHQIFACAQGCLRGVILTAAEMNAMERMSWISVTENDMFNGELERNIVDGCVSILQKMKKRPAAILLFLSCIHFFAGVDFDMILRELRQKFPAVDFIDCYMNPTMRKSGLTPDQLMRKQLYGLLRPVPENRKSVNILGNDRSTDESSELISMIRAAGMEIKDITRCKTYAEYQQMSESFLNITYLTTAVAGGDELSNRLGRKHLYLPFSYSKEELIQNYKTLSEVLGIALPDFSATMKTAKTMLAKAREIIGLTPIEIDYTATPRPLGLARLLTEAGFKVKTVYADVFLDAEKSDFLFLQSVAPELVLSSTLHAKMRFAGKGSRETGKILAIGQKAAYFSGSKFFVNTVSGGGMYGFNGIARLAELMMDAFQQEKDTETVIQYKGLGCESCL